MDREVNNLTKKKHLKEKQLNYLNFKDINNKLSQSFIQNETDHTSDTFSKRSKKKFKDYGYDDNSLEIVDLKY